MKFRSIPIVIEATRFDPSKELPKGIHRSSKSQCLLDAANHRIDAGDWLQINREGFAFYISGDGLAPLGYEPRPCAAQSVTRLTFRPFKESAMPNLLSVAQAVLAVFQLVQKYAPIEQAAYAAWKAGGVTGLITYLKTLTPTTGQPGPSAAEVANVVRQLEAAHA